MEYARDVYRKGYEKLKEEGLKDERVLLLESWKSMEVASDDKAGLSEVEEKMPKRIKKRRMAIGEDGQEMGWEEYYDYIFPDDKAMSNNLKILEMAKKWAESNKMET